ncbi:hypothetical protein [Candidatus Uabimicrobium sp. HlEnr_7]|uniref:hypothetical protein n=1 Tax=Candidatus Uabimicrobium helgolandensis TaxID=3095367 RepID=UPI00355821FE
MPEIKMNLKQLTDRLGIFDGYSISINGENLKDKTESLENCIQNAIWSIEEEFDEYNPDEEEIENFTAEIWSVEDVTVKSVAPSSECIIDHMWSNFEFEDFLKDVDDSQKKSLGKMIEEAISNWVKKEKVNFDYYSGIKSKSLTYKELKQLLSQSVDEVKV